MVTGDHVPKGVGSEAQEEKKPIDPIEEKKKTAVKVGAVGDDDIPPMPGAEPSYSDTQPVSADVYLKENRSFTYRLGKIAREIISSFNGWGKLYLSLENFIISQRAMRNIMDIEGGVEEKMTEEKESGPEFKQPETLEEANILAKRYYLRGIGMGDSLEYLLPYIKFTEQFNPVAEVPKENFIDLVDNKALKNLLKKTDLGDKISEIVKIDHDGLRTGGFEFSNEYVEETLKHYAGDFKSADDKLFCIPNYASLAIFVPDDLRIKFVRFAQANNPNEKPYLVSIVQKGICMGYHVDKDSLVPTPEELNQFVEASGEKKITDLLEFLHKLDTKFSATAQILGADKQSAINERIRTFAYKDVLKENNPKLCYEAPDQKPPQPGSGGGIL